MIYISEACGVIRVILYLTWSAQQLFMSTKLTRTTQTYTQMLINLHPASALQTWPFLTLTKRASSCTWRHYSRCFPKVFPWKPSRRWRPCQRWPQPASPGWRPRSTLRSRPSSASLSRLDAQHFYTFVMWHCYGSLFLVFLDHLNFQTCSRFVHKCCCFLFWEKSHHWFYTNWGTLVPQKIFWE